MDRYQFEKHFCGSRVTRRVMGLDEVGRGCLMRSRGCCRSDFLPGEQLDEKIADSKSIDQKTGRAIS
jgi:ribonuclease HII